MIREGLHAGIPLWDYVADPCESPSLSAGLMHTLVTRSPAHAWVEHPRLNPGWKREDSARAEIGTAVHAAIMGGAEIIYAPAQFEDWRKKDAQAFRDAARAEGKTPLLARQRAVIECAAAAGRKRLDEIAGRHAMGMESTVVWRDGETWKRGRPDVLIPTADQVIDIKTMESVDPESWIRTSLSAGGYDIQSAHYLEGLRKLGILSSDHGVFTFLLVEIEPPFSTALVALDPEYAELAHRRCRFATRVWARCLASGEWPGYDPRIHWASPPPWLLGGFEEREAGERQAAEAGRAVLKAKSEAVADE